MSHTFHRITYHVAFSTKDRAPLMEAAVQKSLYAYMASVINNEFGFARLINGTEDHVHILADLRPAAAPADMLNRVKTFSSRWLKKTHPLKEKFAWQKGYGIFSVSSSLIPKAVKYIRDQKEHHRNVTFKEELINFLKRHKIDYDERYLWI